MNTLKLPVHMSVFVRIALLVTNAKLTGTNVGPILVNIPEHVSTALERIHARVFQDLLVT